MFNLEKCTIALCVLILIFTILSISPIIFAQDETNDAKVIERYRLMLSRKPRESSTFDRLYQFYLDGTGLAAMVTDYQAEAQAKPNDPNIQLILGHIYKRLGKDKEALAAYQRAVALAQNDYYAHFALGQFYVVMRQHEDAISELTNAATLSEQTQTISPEELTDIYKTLGHAYFSRDKLEEAIKAWEKISELDPQNIFARIELADLFREQELYPQAIAQHQAIIDIKKDDAYRKCLSLREIGKIHEGTGAYDKARQHYDEALNLTAPGNWLRKDLQHRIIAIYSVDANWKGLITYYQGKIETNPNDPEMLGLLASAYIENQQLDEGINTYRKGLELAPTDTGLRLSLIDALRNSEMSEDAASEYEKLSEQQPDDFGIYRELGKLYVQLENVDKAKAIYQKMIDRDPKNASTYLTLAAIYTGHEWLDDAVAAYQKAISLAPENLDYIEYFGEFYFRQANREKAVETWNQMVSDEKRTAENYNRLARLLETKIFPTEAIEASRKAVELAPDAYRFREALAKRLMNRKQYDEALLEYTEAVKLAPNDFFAEQMDDQRIELYQRQGTLVTKIEDLETQLNKPGLNDADRFTHLKRLAKMYIKLQYTTYALEVLLEAKALQPDAIIVNRRLAELYTKQGRRDDSNAIYKHLINVDTANAREYYTNITNAYLKGKDFEAATTTAKQVVAHSPRNPEGHQLLALIAKSAGNYNTAIASLKQAVRLRPDATDIRKELAEIYKLSGNHRQALDQYWQCWKLSVKISEKLAFVKPLSELYYTLGQHNEFEEKLKQLSKSDPSSIAAILTLANIYQREGDLSKAKFQYARALDRESDNPELLEQLVNISLELGNTEDALNYQQQLVKAHPNANHQQKLGELLFDAGWEQEAIQIWTKSLHSKNRTLDAEIKLATVLINYELLEDAILILDRAAKKTTNAIDIYKIGLMLVEMNQLENAQPHFQRILEMSELPAKQGLVSTTTHITPTVNYSPHSFPVINLDKFNLPQSLVYDIQQQPNRSRNRQSWMPKNFEEVQAGALVQLTTIAQQQGKLNELIQQYEANLTTNPKNIQTLETLAKIYILINNSEKVSEITKQLLSVSPNDPVYQSMRLRQITEQNLDYETWKIQFDKMTALTPEAHILHVVNYATHSFFIGNKENAEKAINQIDNTKVTDFNTVLMLVQILVELGKINQAEKMLAQLPVLVNNPSSQTSKTGARSFALQQQGMYSKTYITLASAYLNVGQTEKAMELFWKFFENTMPTSTHAIPAPVPTNSPNFFGGYTLFQSNFPSPTIYYNQDRLRHLQQFFNIVLLNNQKEALYNKLQAEIETANSRKRIFPKLALSYCYWWDGKRTKAQEILSSLQNEFPEEHTLKLNTASVSIYVGEHKIALDLIKELADTYPRHRRQYNQTILQLAIHIGDTATIRELVTKLLNSPSSVRELFQLSQRLQITGQTQFAVAVAKKAADLAQGEQDQFLLMQLSSHLKTLGQEQDAARLTKRASRLNNQQSQSRRTLSGSNSQQTSRQTRNTSVTQNSETKLLERETKLLEKLLEAAQKNPKSYQAQINLATFYERSRKFHKASRAFEATLALRQNDITTRKRYAETLQRAGQFEKAVEQYNILIKHNPNVLGNNYRDVITVYFRAEKVDELVSLAKDMIVPSVGQNTAKEFARSIAQQCIRYKNRKAAIEIYEKMVKVDPTDYHLYKDLTTAYFNTGQRDKAIQFLREKLENNNLTSVAKVETILLLSQLYKTWGKLREFTAEYEEKLSQRPTDPSLIFPVALMKIGFYDFEGSDTLVDQLFANSSMAVVFDWVNRLADAYRTAGERDREIRVLEIAIQKVNAPNSWRVAEIYQKLGAAYFHKNEKLKGQDTLRKMGAFAIAQSGSGFGLKEKERIAKTYLRYAMWDDAAVFYTDISNDLSASQSMRQEAQYQLMFINHVRSVLPTSTSSPK